MNLEHQIKRRALMNWLTQISMGVNQVHNNPNLTMDQVLNWLDKMQKDLPEIKRLAIFLKNVERPIK